MENTQRNDTVANADTRGWDWIPLSEVRRRGLVSELPAPQTQRSNLGSPQTPETPNQSPLPRIRKGIDQAMLAIFMFYPSSQILRSSAPHSEALQSVTIPLDEHIAELEGGA